MRREADFPKIGLALGSGGPRGLAHIGVIKALEQEKIPIDFIAGCSIGAMVGGMYAATNDITWIEKIALETDWKRAFSLLVEPSLLSGGLIGGVKVEKFLLDQIGKKEISELKIPFVAITTNIRTGKEVRIKKGDLAKAIRASSSTPLVFKPTTWEGKLLVDGGLSNPVPGEVVRKMGADIVIAVSLDDHFFHSKIENSKKDKLGIYRIANNTINILRYHLAQQCMENVDIIINPKISKTNWVKFINGEKIIKKGEDEAKLLLPEIKKLIQSKSKKKTSSKRF